jgi:hypothetical protein
MKKWIRNLLCITKSESPTTVQFDSQQAITRLLAARVQLFNERRLGGSVCVYMEDNWKLDRQLSVTNIALERSIYLLQRSDIVEHKCVEEAVLVFEQLPSIVGDVLQRIEAARRTGQKVPNGLQLRTNKLILNSRLVAKSWRRWERPFTEKPTLGEDLDVANH